MPQPQTLYEGVTDAATWRHQIPIPGAGTVLLTLRQPELSRANLKVEILHAASEVTGPRLSQKGREELAHRCDLLKDWPSLQTIAKMEAELIAEGGWTEAEPPADLVIDAEALKRARDEGFAEGRQSAADDLDRLTIAAQEAKVRATEEPALGALIDPHTVRTAAGNLRAAVSQHSHGVSWGRAGGGGPEYRDRWSKAWAAAAEEMRRWNATPKGVIRAFLDQLAQVDAPIGTVRETTTTVAEDRTPATITVEVSDRFRTNMRAMADAAAAKHGFTSQPQPSTVEEIEADTLAEQMHDALRAGGVNRWHSHPNPCLRRSEDRIDGHEGRAALLAWQLWRDKMDPEDLCGLMAYLASHDRGESLQAGGPGDMPGSTKTDAPELHGHLNALEQKARSRMGLPVLDPRFEGEAKLVDLLDARAWVAQHAPRELRTRYWRGQKKRIRAIAGMVGERPVVDKLLRLIKKRA